MLWKISPPPQSLVDLPLETFMLCSWEFFLKPPTPSMSTAKILKNVQFLGFTTKTKIKNCFYFFLIWTAAPNLNFKKTHCIIFLFLGCCYFPSPSSFPDLLTKSLWKTRVDRRNIVVLGVCTLLIIAESNREKNTVI